MTSGRMSALRLAAMAACALGAMTSDARAQTRRTEQKRADQVRPDTLDDDDAPRHRGSTVTISGPGSYQNALRIARMLNDDRIVAQLLARQGLTSNASDAELRA